MFETMCGWQIRQTSIVHGPSASQRHDLSGIISISGKLRATIVVSLSKELAYSVAESFLGVCPTSINSDVIDLVGELTNMICGNAKERLNANGLALGLPTVIVGSDVIVAFESGLAMSQLSFEHERGAMSIQIGFAGSL